MLSWAEAEGAAVIPFGGGTSVVGGVEARLGERPVVSLDLRRLDRVLEVDAESLAARIQAGATGPGLEEQLREHGLTLRHFPQSFEYSTLGGWIATRAGGHFATLYTHIDDLVESVRAITPRGTWESRRLPGSGAGPSPDRALIGSEGILGVIAEAWVRVRPRPQFKASCGVEFDDFLAAARAVREISQSGLYPSNCRLLDALRGGHDRRRHRREEPAGARLRVRRTSRSTSRCAWRSKSPSPTAASPTAAADGPQAAMCRLRPVGRRGRRRLGPGAARSCWRPTCATPSSPAACSARPSRRRSPGTASRSSTPTTMAAVRAKVAEVCGAPAEGAGRAAGQLPLHPRLPRRPGALLHGARAGGPRRRGRAVGRDQGRRRRGADRGRRHDHPPPRGRPRSPPLVRPPAPGPFAAALRAAKAELDPAGMLNPGVLIDP